MADDAKPTATIQVDVLREIGTPLKLYGLVILVVEVVLGALAAKATGTDFTLLVAGMVGTLVLVLLSVAYLLVKRPEALIGLGQQGVPKVSLKHDVFLSSPMAAFGSDSEYKQDRQRVFMVIEALKQECRFDSIVYAGNKIESIADFDAADMSINQDFQALVESRYFVMLYPRKIASSVLVEAGWALALRKPSIYFVNEREDLPFLLKQAEQAFSSVKIYDKSTTEHVITLIKRHRTHLFTGRPVETPPA